MSEFFMQWGGPSHCLNPINVSNRQRVQGDCVWKAGETDSTVWPWFELVFTVYVVYKFKTSRPSAISERSQCTLSLARRIWIHILPLRRTSPHPPLSNPREGLRLPVSLSSSGFLFCCFVFVQMAYLRLDYLPRTRGRRSYYLYVCLCTTACTHVHPQPRFAPVFPPPDVCEAVWKWWLRWKGARRRGVMKGRVDAWEWRMKGSLLGSEEMCERRRVRPWSGEGGACFVALERTTLSFQTFGLGIFLQSVAV